LAATARAEQDVQMKKAAFSTLALAAALSTAVLPATNAFAQYYDGPPPRWDHRRPPPPPPQRHHHRDNTGKAIAGGLAAGVIGGLIGGAIVNNNGGPRYVEPPPPPPRCWFEDRRVPNAYDGGWHVESVRVCN
jgi:hypothetical protein